VESAARQPVHSPRLVDLPDKTNLSMTLRPTPELEASTLSHATQLRTPIRGLSEAQNDLLLLSGRTITIRCKRCELLSLRASDIDSGHTRSRQSVHFVACPFCRLNPGSELKFHGDAHVVQHVIQARRVCLRAPARKYQCSTLTFTFLHISSAASVNLL